MIPSEVEVQHRFIELASTPPLRMHYVTAGAGPVVILLHGFPESWWGWRHQIRPLAEAGFTVVAPDLRGYGATDKHGPYDLDTIVGDVCRLIESLGTNRTVRIAGHDWGGATAWHLASTRPEYCERLAVLNCPHPVIMRDTMARRFNLRQLAKSWYMFFFQLPWLPEHTLTKNDAGMIMRMLRGSAVNKANFSAEELRPFRDDIQQPGAARAMVDWYRTAIREGFRRAPPKPAPIEADTLLIWGDYLRSGRARSGL